jgi:hypothetical protein
MEAYHTAGTAHPQATESNVEALEAHRGGVKAHIEALELTLKQWRLTLEL